MRLLFDNAYIPGWLFTLKNHFVESKGVILERSSDLSTVFNLQAAHRELVLCVLPIILSILSLSIEGRPVQLGQSYYHRIPQDTVA